MGRLALQTKNDVNKFIQSYVKHVEDKLHNENQLIFDYTDTAYGKGITEIESILRPLWGEASLAHSENRPINKTILNKIIDGIDPLSTKYWGVLSDRDQRAVEMAVIGYALLLNEIVLWDNLTIKQQEQLVDWLLQINHIELPNNNWHFFRVIVNIGLEKVGVSLNIEKQNESLQVIESLYLGNGWYSDGSPNQMDYYVSFGFHFFSLLYAYFMKEKDAKRSEAYKERALIFAKDFIYWFSSKGDAVPFGRSMTYKFAQSAFWSALAFCDIKPFRTEVIKGIIFRNLRWWRKQPIIEYNNFLPIGYTYPNLIMAEGYNSPGSSFWAFKTLIITALSKDHTFWKVNEEPLPLLNERKLLKEARMLSVRPESDQVYLYTSGQYSKSEHLHNAEKYAKFVYSNLFGFNIAHSNYLRSQVAGDSMLSLSEYDDLFRFRRECAQISLHESYLFSEWYPWHDVQIRTYLIPFNNWHIRIHEINSTRELQAIEGAFSIPKPDVLKGANAEIHEEENSSYVSDGNLYSTITNLHGYDNGGKVITTEPNTNILTSNPILLPSLEANILQGNNLLVSAIYGGTQPPVLENVPRFFKERHGFRVGQGESETFVQREG